MGYEASGPGLRLPAQAVTVPARNPVGVAGRDRLVKGRAAMPGRSSHNAK